MLPVITAPRGIRGHLLIVQPARTLLSGDIVLLHSSIVMHNNTLMAHMSEKSRGCDVVNGHWVVMQGQPSVPLI